MKETLILSTIVGAIIWPFALIAIALVCWSVSWTIEQIAALLKRDL